MKDWEAAKFLSDFSKNVNDVNRLVGKFAPNDLQDALAVAVEALDAMSEYERDIERSYEEGYNNGLKAGQEEAAEDAYEQGYEDGRNSAS